MRTGTSAAEHTLPSSVLNSPKSGNSIDGYETNILSTLPLPDHALNYVVMDSKVRFAVVFLSAWPCYLILLQS
jgi:hypothetical protein